MIYLRLPVIVWGKSVTRLQNKTIMSMWNTLCVSLSLRRAHSIVFHMLLRISLVLPVFLVHPTAKIWRDFSTSLPYSLIFRELWWSFMILYIFDKLKNVQSIVNGRNWTGDNYFQTTWPWRRRRRHRSYTSRIVSGCISLWVD